MKKRTKVLKDYPKDSSLIPYSYYEYLLKVEEKLAKLQQSRMKLEKILTAKESKV